MKNRQQTMGLVGAFALICLLHPAVFAQPATCRDTTSVANYSVVTFTLPGTEHIASRTYMAVFRKPLVTSKGYDLESQVTSTTQFYSIALLNCLLSEPGDPAPMLALKNKREITDPAMTARLKQALLEQLALCRKMVAEDIKR